MSMNPCARHLAAKAEKLAFASGDCYAPNTDLMQCHRQELDPEGAKPSVTPGILPGSSMER
jgi:hypothetical protein